MVKYLTISCGQDAGSARPLLATSDEHVIATALAALLERAGVDEPTETVTRA